MVRHTRRAVTQDPRGDRPPIAIRVADRVLRTVLRGVGGTWLLLTGRGLPRPGEDRVWREIHPDDDR